MYGKDIGLLILRLATGGLLLFHGIAKAKSGLEWLMTELGNLGIPELLAYAVYLGEIVAPIMLILGLKTRLAALIICLNMVIAVLISHSEEIFTLNDHGAWSQELAGLYFFAALCLFFTGGGSISLTDRGALD